MLESIKVFIQEVIQNYQLYIKNINKITLIENKGLQNSKDLESLVLKDEYKSLDPLSKLKL